MRLTIAMSGCAKPLIVPLYLTTPMVQSYDLLWFWVSNNFAHCGLRQLEGEACPKDCPGLTAFVSIPHEMRVAVATMTIVG